MLIDYFASLGDAIEIRKYGKGFLVQTKYCMPQTAEPLVVGVLERPGNKAELTDFSFATEFVQTYGRSCENVLEKICEIAKRHNIQWVDEALTCTCEENEVVGRWKDVLEAMKEVISLYN